MGFVHFGFLQFFQDWLMPLSHFLDSYFDGTSKVYQLPFLLDFSHFFFHWVKLVLVFLVLYFGNFLFKKLQILFGLIQVCLYFGQIVLSFFSLFHETLYTCCVFQKEVQLVFAHLWDFSDFTLLYNVVRIGVRKAETVDEIFKLSFVQWLIIDFKIFAGEISPRFGDFEVFIFGLLTKINLDHNLWFIDFGASLK